MRNFIILFLLLSISTLAQDSTRSEAFKNNQLWKPPLFKAKYPSYSLLAGYLLVTEANRGDPFAQHELGIRYLLGQGFPPDTVKAVYWIRKAVDQNLPTARYNYGILLNNGIGVPWNPFEAYLNFENSSNAGLPESQFALGLLMTDNLAVNKNMGEAYKLFQVSAQAGYQPAKEVLEQLKKSGFIPPGDSSKSQNKNSLVRRDDTAQLIDPEWDLDFYDFEQSEKEKSNVNQINETLNKNSKELKRIFGLNELDENVKLADTSGIGILKFAADNGSPEALFIIAVGYEKGVLFGKNLITAAMHYLRAYRLGSFKAGKNLFGLMREESFINALKEKATKNDAEAMYVFAGITALGFTNLISDQQALELLRNAVSKKHIPSMIELGLCYSSGTLVKKDISKAIEYWELAKNLGSKEASVRIAFTHAADSTNKSNLSEQIEILQKAANEGSVLAQTLLGYCYERGLGVRENKRIAARLFRHAAQRGNQAAINSLKRMYDEIRPLDDEFQIFQED